MGFFPAGYRPLPIATTSSLHNGSYRSAPDTAVPWYPRRRDDSVRWFTKEERRFAIGIKAHFTGMGGSCDPRSKRDVPETAHHCPPRVLLPGPAAGIHIWSCSLSPLITCFAEQPQAS